MKPKDGGPKAPVKAKASKIDTHVEAKHSVSGKKASGMAAGAKSGSKY